MKNYFIHNVNDMINGITPKELTEAAAASIAQTSTTGNKQKSKTFLPQNPVPEPCAQDLINHLENELMFAEFLICRN